MSPGMEQEDRFLKWLLYFGVKIIPNFKLHAFFG